MRLSQTIALHSLDTPPVYLVIMAIRFTIRSTWQAPGGWPNRDYRVLDLVLLTPDCFHIDHNEYFEGAPTVVVEIHSPNDESYEKLAFYHGLRVPEVWIVHRDTRQPEIHVWGDQEYTVARANENGSVRSSATHIEMRASEDRHLIVRFAGDVATERGLPE